MKNFLTGLGIISAVLLLIVLCFGATWLGIEWRGFFGPKAADVEHKIFKKTRAYNEGKAQELAKYRHEYNMAETEKQKKSIASTVRHMFAEYDPESLPSQELRDFLREVNR